MTDDEQAPVEDHGEQQDPTPRTGVPEVDAVLDEVESLEDRPVDEHVAVFEGAHERLRRALEGTDGLDRTAGNA